MKTYRVIRTFAGGKDGHTLGFAKQYANGKWVFQPSLESSHKPTGKRFPTFEACLPRWTGGLSGTRSEPYC